jgi:uncharacterized protein
VTPQVCIALHDVAPATWPHCARLLAMLDELEAPPTTRLVVPYFHGNHRIDRDADFIRAIGQRLARGDEIALHGYDHRDRAAPLRSPGDRFRRRVLTAGEGEFAALGEADARQKIERGLELMQCLRWPVRGFVPPAWLAGTGARAALRASGLRWFSTHDSLVPLPDGMPVSAPCLTASSRTAARRLMSRLWLNAMASVTRRAPLVRVGLHPADADHAELMECWRRLLRDLLALREPVTKSQALAMRLRAATAAA